MLGQITWPTCWQIGGKHATPSLSSVAGKFAKLPVQGRLKAPGSKKTGRPEKYHKAFVAVLLSLWEFFDFQCGKLLAPLIKGMIGFLVQKFNLGEDIRSLLLSVSPATIRLVQEHGWFLNKLSKILRILQFFIGSCSEAEVSEQLY
ncbi:MAG: hypothetical protein LBB72_07395 [Spirochaetaceae bacterium]|jgi:hypothetical protein|nr:hypothetical protein [Spirochaetaceae bacterium]